MADDELDKVYMASLQRRVRLVLLLDASREAGLEPLPTSRLHLIGYLSNVLSPIWDMPTNIGSALWAKRSDIGSVLKRRAGPFYPDLQADLDRLVGMGIVTVTDLHYAHIDGDHYRLEGTYRVNTTAARPILACLSSLPGEAEAARSVREIVLALSGLSDDEIDAVATQDATYCDPTIGVDNVVDFGEWSSTNYSAAAAHRASELIPTHASVGPGEKIHLYVRHLRRRLQRVV